MTASEPTKGYLHGYSEEEAQRLLDQAELLAPWVFQHLDLRGVDDLLEVGMGVGAETRLLRRRWPDLRIHGVDVSPLQVERARRTLAADVESGQVSVALASGEKLPFADARFAAVFLCWLLEHVAQPGRVVAECARCLRPGGRLLATEVYNAGTLVEPRRSVIEDYLRAFNNAQRAAGGHPCIAARLPEMAVAAGLHIESFRLVPVIADGRDPQRRRALFAYFTELLRSGMPEIEAAGLFPAGRFVELERALGEVAAAPDALLLFTFGQLVARASPR